jgi:uncharacterized membrane protein YkoI
MRLIPALVMAFGLLFALPAFAGPVNIDEVRAMAFDRGIVRLKEIELDDGIWEVEGRDANGREIEMEVEARTGRIIKLRRD